MVKIDPAELVAKIDEVPSLPEVAVRLLAMLNDEEADLPEIERLLSADSALTANVLRVCNSAYFGFTGRISNLSHALILLGYDNVRRIVLMESLKNVYSRRIAGYALNEGELARHSMAVGLAAEALAREVGYREPETLLIAGLLHEIGKLVLGNFLEREYAEILRDVAESRMDFLEIERAHLGTDHAQIGAKLAAHWSLPVILVECIAAHHDPSLAQEHHAEASLVHLADHVTMMLGIGWGIEGLKYTFHAQAVEGLRLPEDVIFKTMLALPERMKLAELV